VHLGEGGKAGDERRTMEERRRRASMEYN